MLRSTQVLKAGSRRRATMLTLNETFAAPDADHAWSVVNDLTALVSCVPGARVKSVDGPQAVKAEIAVRMGAMGMTFTGPVSIASTDAASRTVTIKANTRETLGQSYATGDITIRLADGAGTVDAIANVGGKAAGMGEGVIVNVLTDLVKAFSANIGTALLEPAQPAAADDPAPAAAEPSAASAGDEAPAAERTDAADAPVAAATASNGHDPASIFRSLTSRFGGRLDVKLTKGLGDAPLLKASGQSFAMLHGDELVVRLHPARCADLVGAGKGRLFAHDGQTHEEWLVVDGLDASEWTAHTMEALACAKD
jgi:carbon monoxide dehydrogenase subunit G